MKLSEYVGILERKLKKDGDGVILKEDANGTHHLQHIEKPVIITVKAVDHPDSFGMIKANCFDRFFKDFQKKLRQLTKKSVYVLK